MLWFNFNNNNNNNNFYPWSKFYFPLFWGMVMYDNEFKQREIKFKPRIKLNHNIIILCTTIKMLVPPSVVVVAFFLKCYNNY